MITYHALQSGVPTRLEHFSGTTASAPQDNAEAAPAVWINLVDPTAEECAETARQFSIPPEHLRAALDFNERPRMEYENHVLLIVARMPFRDDPLRKVPFSTCPIAAILTPQALITVCLKDSLTEMLLPKKILGSGPLLCSRLLLTLLLRISTTFIDELRLMDDRVGRIENSLKESMQNKELINMLHVEKSLIYFLTALKGNQAVLDKLRSGPLLASPEERGLLDDVFIENRQATDMAEIFSHILESLGDTFGAIVSNNLNKVMKVLTGLTVVLMIPSIVGAVYGMNVALPWQDSPYAFALLMAASLAISFIVFYVLRKMDWM